MLIGPGIACCAWPSLLKAVEGLFQSCRGMGLLRSPSQASQLLHGPHLSWEVHMTCGKPFSYGARWLFVPRETCENSHPGIKSLRRRSIGDATLAGRNRKAHQRPILIAGAFFVPAVLRYGGGARDTFGCAGLLSSRSANPRTAATLTCLAASGGSSITKGTHA